MNKETLVTLIFLYFSGSAFSSSKFNKSNLGYSGNSRVLDIYKKFEQKNQSCTPKNTHAKRVILQGFTVFVGIPMNLSGAIVDTFNHSPLFERGTLTPSDFGTRISQKTILINNQEVELCLIVSEVQWDLAALNMMKAIQDFKPHFILQTGVHSFNHLSLETGALNRTLTRGGFEASGRSLGQLNRPQSSPIDDRYVSTRVINNNWNVAKISEAIRPLAASLGYEIKIERPGRVENTYICNNIHYSVLQASIEGNVELLGGQAFASLTLNQVPGIGFLHFPDKIVKSSFHSPVRLDQELKSWSNVVRKIIQGQLGL